MASAIASPEVSNRKKRKEHKKRKKHHHDSEKKSSKKRRREELDEPAAEVARETSPKKKQRMHADYDSLFHQAESGADVPAWFKNAPAAPDSPFMLQTTSMYLPLSPITLSDPIDGIRAEHLSPLLLTYSPMLKGIVLSYGNIRLSEQPHSGQKEGEQVLARCVGEYGPCFVWVTVDFLLIKPRRGLTVEGWVNLQNESHLGLVCWNFFNVSVDRKRLPQSWKWVEPGLAGHQNRASNGGTNHEEVENGYFVDGKGRKVEGFIQFRLRDFETVPSIESGTEFVSLEGTLISDEEERELAVRELQKKQGKVNGIVRQSPHPVPLPSSLKPSGATDKSPKTSKSKKPCKKDKGKD
ncbi:hypothetical protein BDY21DRAFT_352295 [Lineolata rhizophorae]|uniref:DNA-directed RNA polymerase subunit n=1 Tax=Lineolata rhizophorae TaxID=578093 RepID=A0A6A6NTM6_9PEZI|nr:hypothetical protein BDY21DRAFT_352295 [Lineolata rhizophorae]